MQTSNQINDVSSSLTAVGPAYDDGLAAAVVSVMQSVGLELGIFALTLVLAFVVRLAPLGQKIGGCAASMERDSSAGTRKCSPPVRKTYVVPASDSSPSTRTTSPSSSASFRYGSSALSSSSLVEAIFASASGGSIRALTKYGELRTLKPAAFAEALRLTKHTSEELFAAVLLVAGRTDRPDVMVQLFGDMERLGVVRSLRLYESAMRLLAKKHRHKEALQIYALLNSDGLEPSTITLGCLINFAEAEGHSELAVTFFNRISAKEVPSIRAYMSVLRVFSKQRDWPRSLAVFHDCQNNGVADSTILNIVLATGVNSGAQKQAATLLLDAADRKPPAVDTVSFNSVLKGAAQHNDADIAMLLVERMSTLSIPLNAITFNTAIDANVRRLRSADAWRLFEMMRSNGIRPDKFTCSTLVKGAKQSTSAQLGLLLDAFDAACDQCSVTLATSVLQSVADRAIWLGNTPGSDPKGAAAILARARAKMRSSGVTDSSVSSGRR